ncbi:MAG TPA: hypothetical protein VI588_00265, partial [Candidatus Gracilibacteria bacterium]|nr:hypothetical protein [Candidatus Gracilibacteria bacterium]
STMESTEGTSDEPDAEVVELPPVDGFSVFESESLGFSMQYPKKWFFSGSASTEAGVVRHYDFGGKAATSDSQEVEVAGVVALDLLSSGMPSGTSVSADGKSFIKVTSGDDVQYFYQGQNGRVYRVAGPSSQDTTLLQMAASIQEE